MGIGGIGNIGSVYPAYVYNPNIVSSKSMNKLSRISDDVLDKKLDYSEMSAQENQNPLKRGETIDFEGMLAKQLQQGKNRAAKIMPEGLEPARNETQAKEEKTFEPMENVALSGVNSADEDIQGGGLNMSLMQRAIQSYEMFMTA